MPRQITSATSLEHLRETAKRWLRDLRSNSPEARVRFERAYPKAPAHPMLRNVQHALAREYGYESWILLKQAIQKPIVETIMSSGLRTVEEYERLAQDLVLAHGPKDEAALGRPIFHMSRGSNSAARDKLPLGRSQSVSATGRCGSNWRRWLTSSKLFIPHDSEAWIDDQLRLHVQVNP